MMLDKAMYKLTQYRQKDKLLRYAHSDVKCCMCAQIQKVLD